MPRDGTQTRVRLLDAAERLIERHGFAGTSVDAILEEAGSSKGAFFHHFSSKQALAHALVSRYVDADLGMLDQGLAAAGTIDGAAQKVLAFLGFYETWAEELVGPDSACLYIAAVSELELLDDGGRAEMRRAMDGWREGFAALLRPALPPTSTIDADDLADHLFATFEGAFMMCRILASAEPMRTQLRIYRELVESVLGIAR